MELIELPDSENLPSFPDNIEGPAYCVISEQFVIFARMGDSSAAWEKVGMNGEGRIQWVKRVSEATLHAEGLL